jgi:hypothetical protein
LTNIIGKVVVPELFLVEEMANGAGVVGSFWIDGICC